MVCFTFTSMFNNNNPQASKVPRLVAPYCGIICPGCCRLSETTHAYLTPESGELKYTSGTPTPGVESAEVYPHTTVMWLQLVQIQSDYNVYMYEYDNILSVGPQVSVSAQQPAHRDPFYKITQRLPWWPPCHGMTRWLHSISHLSSALPNRSGTDCDSCVTSQAQRAVMQSQASAVLHPIWPSLDVRMQRLQECSVGCCTICSHCVSFHPLYSWESTPRHY